MSETARPVVSTAQVSTCLTFCISRPFVSSSSLRPSADRGMRRLCAVGAVVVREVGPYRRAEAELFRAVVVLVGRETGPWRRPKGALRKEILESARAPELGPRLADAQASTWGEGSCFGCVGCRGARDEDQAEVVVGQLVGVRHEEVRRDPPVSAAELALTALDLPDGGAVPEVRVRRAAEPSRADAAEGEYVAWGELDRPGLVEGAVSRQGEAR